eukprot:5027872-Amphidinium_carterae.1
MSLHHDALPSQAPFQVDGVALVQPIIATYLEKDVLALLTISCEIRQDFIHEHVFLTFRVAALGCHIACECMPKVVCATRWVHVARVATLRKR